MTGPVKRLCEAVWKLEREFDLLSWEVEGVKVWQYQRTAVYQMLATALGIFEDGQDVQVAGAAEALRHGLMLVRGSIAKNPLLARGHVDAVVFEGGRSRLVDGKRITIHTHYLVQRLAAEGKRLLLLDRAWGGGHLKEPDPRRRYLDFFDLGSAVRSRLAPKRFGSADAELVSRIERHFELETGARVSLRPTFERAVARFISDHALHRHLFQRRRPRELYCVCAYGQLAPAIKAAKDCGALTIELQHGVVSRYHLGYSFPGIPGGGLDYFPDRFYAWGEAWTRFMGSPIPADRIVAYGYPYFEEQRRKLVGVAKIPGRLVVLSQGAIGRQLSEFLHAHSAALARFDIVYRPHPGEAKRWRDYPGLRALSKQKNVTIAPDGDLLRALAEAEYQIGVNSTALYEGIALGAKTIVVDLPGAEYLEDLLEDGTAVPFAQFLAQIDGVTRA